MRGVGVLAIAIGACAGPPPSGRVDANPFLPDARAADAAPMSCGGQDMPPKPPGAAGQLVSGVYAITWTPVLGTIGNVNPLLGTDRVTIDMSAGGARWDSATCVECVGDHHGAAQDGCLLVAAGLDGTASRDPYWICATADGVIADLSWCGFPGPPALRIWRATGALVTSPARSRRR